MRLSHFIAKCGYASRRKADTLIKNGKVRVNGKLVYVPFFEVEKDSEVKVESKIIKPAKYVYFLFNKPKGIISTVSDKFAEKKVVDFFPKQFKGIYPVGRLDKNSCGLLIVTNDGDLCYRVTHPKFAIEKEYLLELIGRLSINDCRKAKKGINTKSGYLKLDGIEILNPENQNTLCRVIIREGKKRHLRVLFGALGFTINELKRMRIGGVVLSKLASGKYKMVEGEYIYSLLFNRDVRPCEV